MHAHQQLDSPFRRALLYVVQQLGEVGVTKLEKILYLADLEHYLATGRRITGARWVRYTNGPIAKSVLPSTRMMDGHELSVTQERIASYDSRVYRPGPAPRFDPRLGETERAVLDRIIDLTRDLTAGEAIDLAYGTAPMRVVLRDEADAGGDLMLHRVLPFRLDERTIATAAGRRPQRSAEERADFKRRELERIDDLREAALASSRW